MYHTDVQPVWLNVRESVLQVAFVYISNCTRWYVMSHLGELPKHLDNHCLLFSQPPLLGYFCNCNCILNCVHVCLVFESFRARHIAWLVSDITTTLLTKLERLYAQFLKTTIAPVGHRDICQSPLLPRALNSTESI